MKTVCPRFWRASGQSKETMHGSRRAGRFDKDFPAESVFGRLILEQPTRCIISMETGLPIHRVQLSEHHSGATPDKATLSKRVQRPTAVSGRPFNWTVCRVYQTDVYLLFLCSLRFFTWFFTLVCVLKQWTQFVCIRPLNRIIRAIRFAVPLRKRSINGHFVSECSGGVR